MNEQNTNTGVTYGLIAGLSLIVLTVLLYLGGVEYFLGPFAYTSYIIVIVLAVLAALKKKKLNGGYLPFAEALKITFSVFAIAFLAQVLFNYILMNFIDTGFRDALTQATYDKMESMMRRFGATDEQIDKQLDAAMKDNPHSIKNAMLGYAIWCIVFFLVSLIISAIVKKNKPEFENSFNQS